MTLALPVSQSVLLVLEGVVADLLDLLFTTRGKEVYKPPRIQDDNRLTQCPPVRNCQGTS